MRSKINWLVLAITLIAFVGFLDATYLTVKSFTGDNIKCLISEGCDAVTTSEYSKIFGIPVALLGAIYYLTIFLLGVLSWQTESQKLRKILFLITPVGLLASMWFVYLQLFVINAICFYCIVSAITSTIIFVLGMVGLKYNKNDEPIRAS